MKNFIKLDKINKKQMLLWTKNILFLALPFLLMSGFIAIVGAKVNYFRVAIITPNILFTVIWTLLIVLISLSLKKIWARIIYGIGFTVYFLLFLTNCIYFGLTGFFFNFNLMLMAGEGSAYIWDTIIHTSPVTYLVSALILSLGIFIIVKMPKQEKTNIKRIGVVLIGFIVIHLFIPILYGNENTALKWNNFNNPKNIYESFYDKNKAMKVSGFMEYSMRDFYLTFLKPEEPDDPEEIQFLKDVYDTKTQNTTNEYTGIFEGKNVIFLQLEGIDSWLLNEADMPNLYALMNNSFIFENHYSYYNGGGSTFNSELAVNTGFITPITITRNAYTFNTNNFCHSLAYLLGNKGYSVNAFHMNSGEFYSRKSNYINWGYDNYHGLVDEQKYTDISYELDRELILNKDFYNVMFKQEQDSPFMEYIITYTPHTPFGESNEMSDILLKEKYGDVIPDLTEEDYAKLFAGETDKMVGLLMQALEDNDLLENTVIIGYADHYLYTLNDKTILDNYKKTDNNMINHTPFFIWSNDNEKTVVSKINSQIDILPTALNLLGIDYVKENYIGNDIFDFEYSGYAFFSDYSWYNGEVYVENGEVSQIFNDPKNYTKGWIDVEDASTLTDDDCDLENVRFLNELINKKIQQNDLTLKYDYFGR